MPTEIKFGWTNDVSSLNVTYLPRSVGDELQTNVIMLIGVQGHVDIGESTSIGMRGGLCL